MAHDLRTRRLRAAKYSCDCCNRTETVVELLNKSQAIWLPTTTFGLHNTTLTTASRGCFFDDGRQAPQPVDHTRVFASNVMCSSTTPHRYRQQNSGRIMKTNDCGSFFGSRRNVCHCACVGKTFQWDAGSHARQLHIVSGNNARYSLRSRSIAGDVSVSDPSTVPADARCLRPDRLTHLSVRSHE